MDTQAQTLTGRVAIVTGASSGIGAATAERLAAAGARVAVVARRTDRIDALADRIGGLAVAADVADATSVTQLAEAVHAELGRVDLVVANAGAMLAAPFATADVGEWDRMLDVNVRGLLYTGRAFIADLLAVAAEGGRADLVHTGSLAAHQTFPNYAVYYASKAAVAHLTANLRTELGPQGVRVKVVEPGLVSTELGDDMLDGTRQGELTTMRSDIGALEPGDIAEAIHYAVAAPPRVNVAELIVVPTAQG